MSPQGWLWGQQRGQGPLHNPVCSCPESSHGWRPQLCSKQDFTLHQLPCQGLLPHRGDTRQLSLLRYRGRKKKKQTDPSLFSQLKLILVQPLRGIVFESRASSVDGAVFICLAEMFS